MPRLGEGWGHPNPRLTADQYHCPRCLPACLLLLQGRVTLEARWLPLISSGLGVNGSLSEGR